MDINNELVLQEPIIFQGIKIYQPTIQNIFNFGVSEYNSFLIPYSITPEMLNIPEEHKNSIKMFDVIIYDKQLSLILLSSLKYFCKTDDVALYKDTIIINTNILYRDNFDEFADIILKIHAREKVKEDKLPDNPKHREIELKLRALRAKQKNNNEFQLCDIINIVKYGGKYHISTEEIKNMTLWELTNAYGCKLGVSNYEDSLSIALVCGDKNNNLNDKHWSKLLKVSK